MKRRQIPVAELRVTNHAIRVLQVMRDTGAHIHYDEDVCVLLTEPQRPISHKALKSLRAMRFVRPRDDDKALHVLTNRALELLDTDPRTRARTAKRQKQEVEV
jgi:hypothetical protein